MVLPIRKLAIYEPLHSSCNHKCDCFTEISPTSSLYLVLVFPLKCIWWAQQQNHYSQHSMVLLNCKMRNKFVDMIQVEAQINVNYYCGESVRIPKGWVNIRVNRNHNRDFRVATHFIWLNRLILWLSPISHSNSKYNIVICRQWLWFCVITIKIEWKYKISSEFIKFEPPQCW